MSRRLVSLVGTLVVVVLTVALLGRPARGPAAAATSAPYPPPYVGQPVPAATLTAYVAQYAPALTSTAQAQPTPPPATDQKQEIILSHVPTTPQPTPTFAPSSFTVTPIVVPANYPTPPGPPTRVPYPNVSSLDFSYTVAQDVKLAVLIAQVSIERIDPPIFLNPANARPAVLGRDSVFTPATLRVLQVYKGPQLTEIAAGQSGACFGTSECVVGSVNWQWTDLIGYKIIVFSEQPLDDANTHGAYYFPFRMYVVTPGKDEIVDVARDKRGPDGYGLRSKLSDMVATIQAAAATGH